jgi:rubrerythrin
MYGLYFAAFHQHLNETPMPALKGSKTEQSLTDAFAGESQANRRYFYVANKADIEGQHDVTALFRSTAEGDPAVLHADDGVSELNAEAGVYLPTYWRVANSVVHQVANNAV